MRALLFFIFLGVSLWVVGYRLSMQFAEYSFPATVEGTEYEVSARRSGRVFAIHVETNTRVERDQILIELVDETAQTEIEAASGELLKIEETLQRARQDSTLLLKQYDIREKIAEASAEIQSDRLGIENLRIEIASASTVLVAVADRLARSETLFEQEALTRTEIEKRRMETLESEQSLRRLQADLARKELSIRSGELLVALYREEEANLREETNKYVADLEISLGKKRGELKTLNTRLREMVIRAEKPGVVAKISRSVGEHVSTGEVIARVSTGERIWVETYLTSEKLDQMKEGDEVMVQVPTSAPRPIRLPARVQGILPVMQSQPGYRPGPFEESTERVAVVLVEFDDPEEAKGIVRPGQRVQTTLYSKRDRAKSGQ